MFFVCPDGYVPARKIKVGDVVEQWINDMPFWVAVTQSAVSHPCAGKYYEKALYSGDNVICYCWNMEDPIKRLDMSEWLGEG